MMMNPFNNQVNI